ncbi:hypothetical protein A1O1_05350 [Capronia coronata CBS 617.96]|uniref:Uncharacterized protein n=1 Tax=Capronia coronata CBS 617.96 TaxID=1182541 RepID=W9YFJ3_9EURO|nr:uncharacterized protein A1O1_05350 [Capronia coronata CBS 617.96]EXJ88420.1 hypothetical protein A1O1_05350 [Capronia coronata CBS 617.96]
MDRSSIWIERGRDGRAYFVRRKPKLPSTRRLLLEALLPRNARSLLSFRDSRLGRHVQVQGVSTSGNFLALPAPSSPYPPSGPTNNPGPMDPTSQAQAQPVNMYLLPPPQNPEPPQLQSHDKPAHFAHPPPHLFPFVQPPSMYPIPPHPMTAQPQPSFQQPVPFQSHPSHFAAAPPGTIPIRSQPQGLHATPMPPVITPSDMRYKCDVCGRFRSTRYHYQHPIPTGQLPCKTICRKCREQATDSEDYSSSDSYRSSNSLHRRPRRLRQRSKSVYRRQDHQSRRRAHSTRRGRSPDDGYSRYGNSTGSDSDSVELERDRVHDKERRRSRAASVSHRRRLRLSPRGARVSYQDDPRDRRTFDDPRDLDEEEYEYEIPRRVRIPSRASSRGRRTIRQQYSNVYVEIPQEAEHHVERYEYIAQPPVRPFQQRYPPQQGPPLAQVRAMPPHVHERRLHSDHYHAADHYEGDGEETHRRTRSRSARRGRLRSRETNVDDNGGMMTLPKAAISEQVDEETDEGTAALRHDRRGRQLVYAPSPPPAPSSSLGYMAGLEMDENDRDQTPYGGPQRRRSRSRPLEGQPRGRSILKPGDELTVVERHAPRHSQDYDWYDNEGIRVRVREI